MRKHHLAILGVVACACVLMANSFVYAEDKEDDSKVAEAANQVIEGLPAALKAGVDFSKMTPEQKVDWVLTSVESKVQEDVADKFKDELFDKIKDMTKEGLRAKMFLDTGVPQIKHAYAMGKTFDWAKIDAEIGSQVDTRMNALGAGVKAVQIGWGAYEAYCQGSWSAAAQSVGGEIADMLAEAVVPGYGYIKIGAEMVEFLGNYVLDYATDTAVEGMLNSMYGMKSDPQGLAQWLINKSPADISRDINDKFDSGEGFGYLYRGQGTDSGEDAIKGKIQQTLIGLRGELLVKKREQEQKEQRIKQDIENYLQKYRASQAKVKAVADKAKGEADKILSPVKDFRRKLSGLKKQDVQEDLGELNAAMNKPGAPTGEGVAYVSLNPKALVAELRSVYAEIKDVPGSGFDRDAMDRAISEYRQRRHKVTEEIPRQNQENCRRATKQIEDQFRQPMADLADRITHAKEEQKPALKAQLDALGNQYWALYSARVNACSENARKLQIEMAELTEEEKIVQLEAQERADILSEKLQAGLQRIAEGIRAANREREEARTAMYEKMSSEFGFISLFTNRGALVHVETCAGICGIVDGIKDGKLELFTPGNLDSARNDAQTALDRLKADQKLVGKYSAQERDILKKYQSTIIGLRKEYESLVPESLRTQLQGGNAEAQKAMDESVAQYGAGNGGSEIWGILPAPLVELRVNVDMPSVTPPVRYFDREMADLAKLEPERQKKFSEGVSNVERMMSVVDYYADLDRIAVQIIRLAANIDKTLAPVIASTGGFHHKNGVYSFAIPPDESDEAEHLKRLKAAWQEHKPYVERLLNNVKAYGKGVKYISMTSGIGQALERAKYFGSVPDKIAALEDGLAKAKAEYDEAVKSMGQEYAKLVADFESLQDPQKAHLYFKTLQNLRQMLSQIFKYMEMGDSRVVYKKQYTKLRDDLEAYVIKRTEEDKKSQEEYRQKLAAEASAAAAAERARQEKVNAERVRETNPLLYYGYQLLDVRVNTYSLPSTSGEIMIAKDRLVGGQVEITARLNHIDHAKTMLISEDGGRTWKQIALSRDVRYAFTPIPNKRYQPVLKIKTNDMVDVGINFLDGGALVYQNADFSQDVLRVVQEIAESYERQDIGAFSAIISRDFLGNKTTLEEGVRFDFDMFTDIRLKLYVDRIDQRSEMFAAEIRWDKAQTPRKTGETQKTTGKTTMMFVLEDGRLKLKNLRGNLIYATLSPDIAQASGLKSTVVDDIRTAQSERNPTQPGAGITEDAGGTSGSAISVYTATLESVPEDWGTPETEGLQQSMDFYSRVVSNDSTQGDAFLETNMLVMNGSARIERSMTDFDDLTTAPATITGTSTGGAMSDNETYVFVTNEGYYGKMKILSHTDDGSAHTTFTFKYAVQTEGSNLTTTQ